MSQVTQPVAQLRAVRRILVHVLIGIGVVLSAPAWPFWLLADLIDAEASEEADRTIFPH
jgi:hypothetical protein